MFNWWKMKAVWAVGIGIGGRVLAADNLLLNPSFEEGQEVPAGWEIFNPPGSSLARDPTGGHWGQAAARMEIAPEGASEYPAFKYTLPEVRPGEEYHGTVWARSEGITGLGGYIVLEFFQGDRRISLAPGDFAGMGDRDWRQLTVRALVPEGADCLKMALVAHGAGKVWFDDAALVRVAEAPPAWEGEQVYLRIRPEPTGGPPVEGLGAQGDTFLTCRFNVDRGVDDRDRERIFQRMEAMRPHILRTFFNYQWWEPEEGRQTPDSEEMRDYIRWVRFLQSIGTAVLLTPWGDYFAYSDWMRSGTDRLPLAEKRGAVIRSLVDLVEFLRRGEGLRNIRYLCLMNEPDSDPTRPVPLGEFVRLNRLLDRKLRERGLRQEVWLLGADECSGGPLEASPWFRQVVAQGLDYCDAVSVHTYRHEYVPGLIPWIRQRRELLQKADPGSPPRPLWVTEFGYGGETFQNWENHKYEYGLFLADFAITALREGVSAVLMWCLMDTYYTPGHRQEYGLWRYRDQDWEPRPGFYAWSLLTRYTRPASQVLAVDVVPPAPAVRAVALRSPEGELTILTVNRYQRPLQATLQAGLLREASLRLYRYTRENVPVPGGGMIGARTVLRLLPGTEAVVEFPSEAFIVLTEVR